MLFDNLIKKELRKIPVFILININGSNRDEKIETINSALREMIYNFKKIEYEKGIIELYLITSDEVNIEVLKDLYKKDDDSFKLDLIENTTLEMLFEKVFNMIEDNNIVSLRSYRPTIILITDSNPTDYNSNGKNNEEIMKLDFLNKIHSGTKTSVATRLAMGIGKDVDINLLKAFIGNNEIPVISDKDNNTILKFFEWFTLFISFRSTSSNPNQAKLGYFYIFDEDERIY